MEVAFEFEEQVFCDTENETSDREVYQIKFFQNLL